MQISKRLEAVAGMVTSGYTVADIGTDHAYIPIYLVENEKSNRVIAMDINKGPLLRAKDHIRQHQLCGCIDTRLSDGLDALAPDEAESIIIAGMGGPLTVRILENGRSKLGACKELILQPQSEIRSVRAYLEQSEYRIVREEMVLEDGKYYPMMRAVKEAEQRKEETYTDGELRYGRYLLREKHPVLQQFLQHELELNGRILSALKEETGESAVSRRREVETEIRIIEQELKKYGKGTKE